MNTVKQTAAFENSRGASPAPPSVSPSASHAGGPPGTPPPTSADGNTSLNPMVSRGLEVGLREDDEE